MKGWTLMTTINGRTAYYTAYMPSVRTVIWTNDRKKAKTVALTEDVAWDWASRLPGEWKKARPVQVR